MALDSKAIEAAVKAEIERQQQAVVYDDLSVEELQRVVDQLTAKLGLCQEALAKRACIFIGLVQLCWVFIFFYFLLVGIWLENSFEMDTAAFMLIVLVATGVDKQVWACRVRNLPDPPHVG